MKTVSILTLHLKDEECVVLKSFVRTGQGVTMQITSVLFARVTPMNKDALLWAKSFVDTTLTKLFVFAVMISGKGRKKGER
jgi:hypothetical protein